MFRNLDRLAENDFDLLIIGGGIYGAAIARQAAYQGMSVALVDQADFGHATSANSLKIIHGGLRYLQTADLIRMRRSIAARRTLLKIAPHLVKPLNFAVPTIDAMGRSRGIFWLALRLNDLISLDRNLNLETPQQIPKGQVVSKSEFERLAPGFRSGRCTGGATWYDAIATDTERLVLEFVMAAAENGACAANYVEVKRLKISNQRVSGAAAVDGLTRQPIDIRAKFTVIAAGPEFRRITRQFGALPPRRYNWAKAVNIFVNKSFVNNNAVGFYAGNADRTNTRLLFCVPWHGGTMIGTLYKEVNDSAQARHATDEDLRELIGGFNHYWPDAGVTIDDIGFCHVGLIPTAAGGIDGQGRPRLLNRSIVIDHGAEDGIGGLISIIGVKYTTAVIEAPSIVGRICNSLNRHGIGDTIETPLPGGRNITAKPSVGLAPCVVNGDAPHVKTSKRLLRDYGALASRILNVADGNPTLLLPLCKDTRLTAAEIIYFVREEMAQEPVDVLLRRTNIGWSGGLSRRLIERCVDIMAQESGWNAEKKRAAVNDTASALKRMKQRQYLASPF